MKVYLLPVAGQFQPDGQPFVYPRHNDDFYCIEQDFLTYLMSHPEYVTTSPQEADWFYLPIFWTRWHLLHNYATSGLDELQQEVNRVMDQSERTFTVCQYDGGSQVNVGSMVTFTGAGRTENDANIPILCKHHTPVQAEKRYAASFSGRMDTSPIRYGMIEALRHRADVAIRCGDLSEEAFVRLFLEAPIALCPHGNNACSFRFYEAMQLGVVPLMIGEQDTRPFSSVIDWDRCSLHAKSVDDIEFLLDHTPALDVMGQYAREVFHQHLDYQKWCPHALHLLEQRS